MAAPQASSRLEMLQARFQQKQLQEKEQKLLQLYDQQQQRAYQVVQRGSAGSNASNNGSGSVKTTTTTHTTSTSQGGKVRQMFDERRQTTVKGIDRSYPLEPLENKLRKQANANGVTAMQRNGNLPVNRQSVSMKRIARADVNSNVNGGKPVVSYHEEISRESFGPFVRRHDDDEEYATENRVVTFANGYYRHDTDEQDEALDQEVMERNRMMAKIHLMGFDESLKHRVRNDLESEEFPEHLMVDVPDKLPKKNMTKKLSQAQARLERFKNTVAKKTNVPKQLISTTVIKKRPEQMESAKSNPQNGNEIAGTSPTRSGSWISERSQRIFANVKNPLLAETRVVDEMSKRRRNNPEKETFSRKDDPEISRKILKARTYPRNNEFKSLTSDGKIFIRHSPSPRFFCTESERSGTTMSIDRKSTDSRLASPDRMKRSTSPQFFCKENERSATTMSIDRRTDGSKSSEWDSEIYGKRSISPRYSDVVSRQNPRTIATKVSRGKSPEWDTRSSSKGSASPPFFLRESERSATATSTDGSVTRFDSSDWGRKLFAKSETTPRYFSKQHKRSETSTNIDRNLSGSPLFYRETSTKRNVSPYFFLTKFEHRRTDKSNSPIWNKGISQRNMNPRYFRDEFQQTGKNIDRKAFESRSLKQNKEILAKQNMQYFDKKHRESTILNQKSTPTKSPSYEEDILKRRSPQFFCKESERSATTMTIDRARSKSTSPSYDRKIITKPSSNPEFFCKESERSATTMSIDRKVNDPKLLLYNRKTLTKETKSPRYFDRQSRQQYAMTSDISQKYDKLITRDKRSTSPQFFCKETERSATTMLIKPKSSATDRSTLKQRNRISNTYKQSAKSPPSINKRLNSTQRENNYTSNPLITKREIKRNSKEEDISVTKSRRSSKISESTATSTSSIVNLKYGLEFDNIFQSAELVRNFMKSQKGEQRQFRQSFSKRNIKKTDSPTTKNIQLMNRYKTLQASQKTRSPLKPEIGNPRRTTPEFPRKSITPTEVDMDIQEITMTDHRLERSRLQNVASPTLKRHIDGTFTKSYGNKSKHKASITYPVRKPYRQKASILGPSVFRKESSFGKTKGLKDRRSDRDSEESAVSLSKLDTCSPTIETSRHIITRTKEDRVKTPHTTQKQTWNQFIKNRTENIKVQLKEYENQKSVSSRSPNQMRDCSPENKLQSSKATSSDYFRRKQHSVVSPTLRESQSKGTRAEFDQSRRLQSTRLVQGALKGKDLSPSRIDDHNQRENQQENRAIDEVDGIDVKYQTIVETALSKKLKNRRKTVGPNPANGIRNKDVFSRKEPRASTKLIASKKTISPRRDCGKWHDIKSNASSRALSSRQTPNISRGSDISQISISERIVSRASRSPSAKFLTCTLKNYKQESVLDTRETAESYDKMNAKDTSKLLIQREYKSENDFGRMDSVESALKRFDSIGAEFERSSPASFRTSPEISLQSMNAQISSERPITSQESTTVDSREVTQDTILKTTLKSAIDQDLKVKNVARKNDLKTPEKAIYSFKRPAKSKSLTGSQRRSTQTRSPTCKRKLFCNMKTEILGGQLKSSHAEACKKKEKSKRLEEMLEFSVKPLHSIEDIRKSLDNKRGKLTATKESRTAIANRQSVSREGIVAKGSISATDAARNVFPAGDPVRLTKVKSYISRTTKSPSPDVTARKQHETNAARTTRGNVSSSPSKSPDIASRRILTDSKNQETKPSRKSAKGADSFGSSKTAVTTAAVDVADGVVLQNGSLHESLTKKSDASVIELDDRPSKESDTMPSKKPPVRKPSSDTTFRGSDRPISSSSSSANSSQSQASNTKARMATKTFNSSVPQTKKTFPVKSSGSNTDNLVPCSICKRNFAQDRINYHETICEKTTSKKRKQFNTKIFRIKGTELEPFAKEGFDKKQESKTKKSEVKSDWRRKHEDFINTIRYAKQVQAHVAAGGNANDISPPPPSDTSDYIQCPHCGRKFNQAAAERHIPKCENMRHNKPAQSRAPRPRR